MLEAGQYYAYGSYLVQPGKGEVSFVSPDAQGDLGHISLSNNVGDQALEQAAKKICNLKCGLCPIQEENFSGCSVACHEEVRPWQCWVVHFKRLAGHSSRSL